MNGDVIRTITIKGQSEGLDKLTADVNKLATAQQNVAVVSEQSAKKVLSLEDAWKRQTLRLDEAARAQANIARETKVADAALREGLATQAQHAQRLELINQRYVKTADATKVVTHQTGLARHELVNLGRQAQDVGVSLMSGQSPFTVLVQQGTQIADVFATSGGTLRGFFGQAVGWAKAFFTSVGGITTAVLGIGAAAIYVASQFVRASTTIEEALENQNRLLKEGKALIDQRTTAEARAQLQSKEQTQFETMRNLIDLEIKLQKEMENTAKIAASRATRPTGGGLPEMGESPTGFAPLKDPGLDKITEAFQRLDAARKAGMPGLKEFNRELSRIGMAYPELAQVVDDLIKKKAGMDLEFATMRARALDDALKGIATDAQLAAVGLGSIAQFNLANLGATEAAAATERMALYTQQIAAMYPGMTIEGAKQLQQAELQANITKARTPEEKNIAEAIAQQAQMLAAGRDPAETLLIIAKQRGVAEKDIAQAIELQNARALQRAQTTVQTTTTTDNLADAADDVADNISRAAGGMASFAGHASRAVGYVRDIWDTTVTPGKQYGPSLTPYGGDMSALAEANKKLYGEGNYEVKTDLAGDIVMTRVVPTQEYLEKQFSQHSKLNSNLERLTNSTDSLNETMQEALSPFYSQDPRTTRLGFRAGTVGNPDWMTGATNANPLVAVLGAGATAPGMAGGGSFTVGGGYSANDNAMAVFPVASGEEVVVNRNRQERGGQVINIDNRIVVNGSLDDAAMGRLKVSRFQQAQRMRGQLARA